MVGGWWVELSVNELIKGCRVGQSVRRTGQGRAGEIQHIKRGEGEKKNSPKPSA